MGNVLITGASGFIGSFLVEEGLKRDYQVYAGIRKTSSRGYLKDPRIHFLEMDFSSVDTIVATLEECKNQGIRFQYIIHSAGITKAGKKRGLFQGKRTKYTEFHPGTGKDRHGTGKIYLYEQPGCAWSGRSCNHAPGHALRYS